MRENRLRSIFQRGASALNGWLHVPSSVSAEAMAHAGFDSLTVDMQHGPIGFETALAMLQAVSTTNTVPLARASWNDAASIMRLLDAGVYGVICPMIEDREQCEHFVRACRYPPEGDRSWGPTRARLYARGYVPEIANETVLTFAMIETARALANVEEIVATSGLDVVYVGPADLSRSLGGPVAVDLGAAPVAEALETIVTVCQGAGVVPGIHTSSAAEAEAMLVRGFRFVTVQSDLAYLSAGAAAVVRAVAESRAKNSGAGERS